MINIETRQVIEDGRFYQLEGEAVISGFRTIFERPDLLLRAETPEAKRLSAALQAKRDRKEKFTASDYEQICEIVFAEVSVDDLKKLHGTVEEYMVGNPDFLAPLKRGILMYSCRRVFMCLCT